MDKILDISYDDLFKQFKKILLPLSILLVVLVLINSYFIIFKKENDFRSAIDFHPLEEFAYSNLWLLQQQFLTANKGLVTFNTNVKASDSPALRYMPQFMHLNELVLFKFFKDYILSNKRRLVSEVSKSLNIDGGFDVIFNDMSNYENRYLANNYVTLTFYNPELKPEQYPAIIEDFITRTRFDVNKVLYRQASKNIEFIKFYIANQENRLSVHTDELIQVFKNKIEIFEEAATEARKLNIPTLPTSNLNYNIAGNDGEKMGPKTININTELMDILPTVSSGYQALEAQAIFYKSELTSVLRSYKRKKFNEIFSLHAKYANSSNILESLSVSRDVSQRKRELASIEEKLELSEINNKISPIVEVKYENIYYYDAKNKLLIPMISISAFFIFLIFGLFVGFNRSD